LNASAAPSNSSNQRSRLLVWCLCAACVIIHFGITQARPWTWQNLSKWGYFPTRAIWWNRAIWLYITNVFIHLQLWHLAFNLYWLWQFGTRIMTAIGVRKWGLLFLLSAFVSSGFQLLCSGELGIGASGVVYAFFGFMWVTKNKYPIFQEMITKQNVALFLGWLILCVVTTWLKIWNIGNAAHISGLLFGMLLGFHSLSGKFLNSYVGLEILFLLFALVPVRWCPLSVDWMNFQAYKEQSHGYLDNAVMLYSRAIAKNPKNAWSYYQRGLTFKTKGHKQEAQQDFDAAHRIDPRYGN